MDNNGTNYCGKHPNWDFLQQTLEISMPQYIPNLLEQLKFEQSRSKHAQHTHTIPLYGQKVQYATNGNSLPEIKEKKMIIKIQHLDGSLLYYARAVDPSFLVALGTIANTQPSQHTVNAITKMINYVATHPLAVL